MPNTNTVNPPMTNTMESAHAAASTLFLGHDGEWWDFWLIVSVIGAAVIATAIGVTTAGSIISHKREAVASEAALEKYKLTVEGQVADAKKEGIEAGKTAGDAMLRAAELEKRAAELRAANLALEKEISPRFLTPKQQQSIGEELKPFAGKKVSVVTYTLDAEGAVLAKQIIASVRSSGILVNDRVASTMPLGGFDAGIVITGLDTALTSAIGQALQNTGKLYVSAPIAAPVSTPADGIALDAQILVGVKPPIIK